MQYDEALAFIHGAYGRGEKRGLSNMWCMMDHLGHPERAFRSVHVAGTNGKGSVCAFLQAVLRCAGYKTGLYTSPFLQRYNERMRIDGVSIPDDRLATLAGRVAAVVASLRESGIQPTEFEIGTAIAFLYFAEEKVDIAIVEVGLGGRLDPTNIITPCVSAIAAIGMDHMKALGDSLTVIAGEKAGIAKRGVPVVVSVQNDDDVLRTICEYCEAREALYIPAKPAVGMSLGLHGIHQEYNAGVAIRALSLLRQYGMDKISDDNITDGLRRAQWPGRLEWVPHPVPLLLDGAHNVQGAHALADYVRALPSMKNILICGIMQDKDWKPVVTQLAAIADTVITVSPSNPRALPAGELAAAFVALGVPTEATESVQEALARGEALAQTMDEARLVVAGSLYLVGEVRTLVMAAENTLLSPA